MKILCFDISSGGLNAALFDEQLNASNSVEVRWQLSDTLEVSAFDQAFSTVLRAFAAESLDAISFSAFMHSCLLLDAEDQPLSPIYTWMDRRGADGVDIVRSAFGPGFHERTGCRFHPMFPVFKLASFHSLAPQRAVSVKALAIWRLIGRWVEDHGTASASGLYNVQTGDWDADLIRIVQLPREKLLPLVEPGSIVGMVTSEAASRYGIRSGIPVVAGSGDGFLANLGSGCQSPSRMAITLGTSASVRQLLPNAVLNEDAGTFCYRADSNTFLLGCASSNGGNVFDWARSVFGPLPERASRYGDLPTFIPLLNGERSPEWNPSLKASWHGVTSEHVADDLTCAVIEGVVFNLAHYVDILERVSGRKPTDVVLSGNGFSNPSTSEILAAVLDATVLLPKLSGLASLRGAAVCGLRALGMNPTPALDQLVSNAEIIPLSREASVIRERYIRYRELREKVTVVLPSGA